MKFRFELFLPISRRALFAFHENPNNLRLIQDPNTFQLISTDGHIKIDSLTIAKESLGPFSFVFRFRHFLYEPPVRFGERYEGRLWKKFEHVHEFQTAGDGTQMQDHVVMELPWFLGGEMVVRSLVAFKVRKVFRQRHTALLELVKKGMIQEKTG